MISNLISNTPAILLVNGPFSVLIFFVLSGFVLSQSVSKSSTSFFLLLIVRYFRLTLPMVLSFIWAWILLSVFSRSRIEVASLHAVGWYHQAFFWDMPTLSQTLRAGVYDAYHDGTFRLNPVIWTMRKELAGSIAIYIIYCLLRERWRWMGLAVMTVVAAVQPVYIGFSIGGILRELWIRNRLPRNAWSWVLLVISLFLASGNGLGVLPDGMTRVIVGFVSKHYYLVSSIAAALVVFSVLTLPAIQRALKTVIPQFLGRISFALYLLHMPLLGSVLAWVDLNLSIPIFPKFVVMLVIFVTLAISAAWVMTIAIDEPLIRTLRRMKSLSGETSAIRNPP
jgi:peptidoglycan/LPS O-acetylase OafA/YrhL